MPFDAFISYASEDKKLADAVCNRLESKGIRCWIAPRDITPGADWSATIVEAIRNTRVLILVFSKYSNESVQVKREVERAVSQGHAIIPFRVEDIPPSPSLEYFISSAHWLDAITPPMERHFDELASAVQGLIDAPGEPEDSISFKTPELPPSAGVFSRVLAGPRNGAIAAGSVGLIVLLTILFRNPGMPLPKNSNESSANGTSGSISTFSGVHAPPVPPSEKPPAIDPPLSDAGRNKASEITISKFTPERKLSRLGELSLNVAMSKIASELGDSLTKQEKFEVAVEPFIGPPLTNGGIRLQNALIRQLTEKGITVRRRADATIEGRFLMDDLADHVVESLAVRVSAAVRDGSGEIIAQSSQIIADDREAGLLLGATVALPPDASPKERRQRMMQALINPRHVIDGNRMFSGPDKFFGVEVLSQGEPVRPEITDDELLLSLAQKKPFAIRLINNSPNEIAARIVIDGLNLFEFAADENSPFEYLVEPARFAEIRGWYIDPQTIVTFLPGEFPQRPQVYSLASPNIGSISITFAASWSKDRQRPQDEPEPERASDETGMGAKVEAQFKNVPRVIGVVRGILSMRYVIE